MSDGLISTIDIVYLSSVYKFGDIYFLNNWSLEALYDLQKRNAENSFEPLG